MTEEYFSAVLLIMQYKVAVQGEILKCDHSNKSCWAVFSHGASYYAKQLALPFIANSCSIPRDCISVKNKRFQQFATLVQGLCQSWNSPVQLPFLAAWSTLRGVDKETLYNLLKVSHRDVWKRICFCSRVFGYPPNRLRQLSELHRLNFSDTLL